MHLILTGATGLVGAGALNQALKQMPSRVTRLSILSRKPVPAADGKPNVEVIQTNDFSTYPPELLQRLKGAEGCVWALGISVTQVGKEEYERITVDYPVAAAEAFAGLAERFNFIYVSGESLFSDFWTFWGEWVADKSGIRANVMSVVCLLGEGATQQPGRFTSYFGRVKGSAESQLLALQSDHPSLRMFSVRPALVDPTYDNETKKAQAQRTPDLNSRLRPWISPPLRFLAPGFISPTQDLGKFLVDLACGDGKALDGVGGESEGRVVSNTAFRRIVGLL